MHQDRATSRARERERDQTHSYWYIPSAPRVDYSLLIMVAAGMMKMAIRDDSPSGRVPERGLDWFSWTQRPCGGGTSDLGLPRRVSEYLGIYSAKRGCGRPPRWAQPTWVRQWALAHLGGLCPPRGTPPECSSGPLGSFWSIKNLQKVTQCLDFV